MNSAVISACKTEIKQTFKHAVTPMPLYIIDVVKILQDKYSKDVVQQACDELCAEGILSGIPDPDEKHLFIIEHIAHDKL